MVEVDGILMEKGQAERLSAAGATAQCPRQGCGAQMTENGWAYWTAYADGYAGYMPMGANYQGNGQYTMGSTSRQAPTLKNRNGQRRPTVLPFVGNEDDPIGSQDDNGERLAGYVRSIPNNIRDVLLRFKNHLQSNELLFCQAAQESGGVGWRKYLNEEQTEWQGVEGGDSREPDLGLMQIQQDTANETLNRTLPKSMRNQIVLAIGSSNLTKEQVRDNEGLNVLLATTYQQDLINRFYNDVRLSPMTDVAKNQYAVRNGLAAYNRGRTNVLKYGLNHPKTISGRNYADGILKCEAVLKGRL